MTQLTRLTKTCLASALLGLLLHATPSLAQLSIGIEGNYSTYRSNERLNGKPLNQDDGNLNGGRLFVSSNADLRQRSWQLEVEEKSGKVNYSGLTNFGTNFSSKSDIKLFHAGISLTEPIYQSDSWGLSVVPRLGYRSQTRKIKGGIGTSSLNEQYQEKVIAIGLAARKDFSNQIGASLKIDLERSFNETLNAQFVGLYQPAQFNVGTKWRTHLEGSTWIKLSSHHKLTLSLKTSDLRSAPSDSSPLVPASSLVNPTIASFPGQKVRLNSLGITYQYTF